MFKNLELIKYTKKQIFDGFNGVDYTIFDVKQAAIDYDFKIEKFLYSIRVLFENIVRNSSDKELFLTFKRWLKERKSTEKINYMLARVPMKNFTGAPATDSHTTMINTLSVY